MKIFELLQSLTPEEKKSLKKNFYTSNKQLEQLWLEISSLELAEFQDKKAHIYRKIYGKPFTEAAEKQFKNSLTLLFQAIRAHIAQAWIDEEEDNVELNKCINYLHKLGLRQSNELFEKEWNYYFQRFESGSYYFGLSKLYFLKFNQTIRNPKLYEEAISHLKASFRYNHMAYIEDSSILSYTALNLNYMRDIYGIDELMTLDTFSTLKKDLEITFEHPLQKALGLIEENDSSAKWVKVHEIFDMLTPSAKPLRQTIKFKLGQSIFNYGILLLYEEEIDKAEIIFSFIEKNDLIKNVVANASVFYFNYSTLLLKKGEVEKALDYHTRVMNNLEHVPIAKKTQYLIREKYLQILNHDYKNLYADLSEIQSHLFKEDQILYVRALLIMYLIDTDDLESALRECENAKRMRHFNSELACDESEMIEFLCKLISLQLKEKVNPTRFKSIQSELSKTRLWTQSSNLLKLWLSRYLDALTKRIN